MTRKEHNIRLAYLGFYTMSEYARLTGTVRQNIHQKVKKKTIDFIRHFNKPYIKYDDGELANKIHGEQQNYLSSLLSFGFKMRTRNYYINDIAVSDVKILDKENVRISFYNNMGEQIIFIAKLKDTSIIKDNGIN
jgi:predicted DNA-binding protein YlxM (UPF0122 family)